MKSTKSAPLLVPVCRSTPTARSTFPSRSRSPIPVTDEPNLSNAKMAGTLFVSLSIFLVSLTDPSGFIKSMNTAPILWPPEVTYGAPTATSGVPSRSKSPIPATDVPNLSNWEMAGAPAVSSSILTTLEKVPSTPMRSMWTAPLSVLTDEPVSTWGEPTIISATPFRSMSPIRATDLPNLSSDSILGFIWMSRSIVMMRLGESSAFIYITYSAPLSSSNPGAPTMNSAVPSRSRSSRTTTDEPNLSFSSVIVTDSTVSLNLLRSISTSAVSTSIPLWILYTSFALPSELRRRTCIIPSSSPRSPVPVTRRSVTPFPSTSPIAESAEPNRSPRSIDGATLDSKVILE